LPVLDLGEHLIDVGRWCCMCSRLADCRELPLEARLGRPTPRFAQGSTHPFGDRQAVSAGGLLNLA
jgi:hypothetical protein